MLYDIATGNPVVPPTECECDEGHLCYAVNCQERSFLAHDEAEAEFRRRQEIPTREEWSDAYPDNGPKHRAYDDLFGAGL